MSSGRSRSGGTRKLKLAETMKQILAEAALLNRGLKVLVGRSHNTDIYLDFPVPAETIKGLSIQHAQQLYLSVQLQFADFVEEQRTPVRHFKQAWLGRIGSAKRALFIPEQLALHQIFRKSSAVDVDPWAAAAQRRLMDRASDQFFAGTSLAGHQNGLRVSGNAVDQCHELVHDGTGKNELRTLDLSRNHSPALWQLAAGWRLAVPGLHTGTTTADREVALPEALRSSVAENCTGKMRTRSSAGRIDEPDIQFRQKRS